VKIYAAQGLPPVSLTPVAKWEKIFNQKNLLETLLPLFATGVVDTGGKFSTGVVDTGGAP
jgi:hypothetical protein